MDRDNWIDDGWISTDSTRLEVDEMKEKKEKSTILCYFPYDGPKEGRVRERQRAVQEVMFFFFCFKWK